MNKKRKLRFKLFCFFIAFVVLAVFLYVSSNRILSEYAERRFNSLITTISYRAIDEIADVEYSYEDLVKIEKNADGDVAMIVTHSNNVNRFSYQIASKTYNYLSSVVSGGVEIPIGAFTGIRLISGFGPTVTMKLLSVTSVKCDMISEFESAGINQTRHTLYLSINCEVDIVAKTGSKKAKDNITVLVYDNLIVGKVPSVYVKSSVIGGGERK